MSTHSIHKIISLLEKEYGIPERRKRNDPLDELILTILSQNTSDKNSLRAFDNLKSSFNDWHSVMEASEKQIADSIHSCGLSKIKAGRIKKILQELYEEKKELSLSFLKDMSNDEIKEYLSKFKGVGPKTIACVQLFALGRNVMPVDTHVNRLSIRLGIVPERTPPDKTQEILEKITPEDKKYSLHINLITHGRKICTSQKPKCNQCVLIKECITFTKL